MSHSILLVHADRSLRYSVRSLLCSVDASLTEAQELTLTDLGRPDLLIIGWRALNPAEESLHWLRRRTLSAPMRTIVLADTDEYASAVRALEYGADDCVRLPLQGDELIIRVLTCLRRPSSSADDATLSAGPIVLDRRVHRVSVNDQNIDLAPTEFRLLAFLLENQGRVFSRGELLTRAWSSNVKAGHRTVDVHVRRLRQQLEPYQCDEMIQTVRGFGYRLRTED